MSPGTLCANVKISTTCLLLYGHTNPCVYVQLVESNLTAEEKDCDVADFLGTSSLKELSIDDDHVKGFDDELLATLRGKLSATQTG